MRVTLFDYGAGNLHSLAKALTACGADVGVRTDPLAALDTDVLVLPGVGAFGPAAARLAPGREAMRSALERGLPCIAICLGMQLLFDVSDEGDGAGLGLIPGRVRALRTVRVPHMGWNSLERDADAPGPASALRTAYFAHSYACEPLERERVTAWTTHEGDRFPASVRTASTLGVQFHPEKSSRAGVAFLAQALADLAPGERRAS